MTRYQQKIIQLVVSTKQIGTIAIFRHRVRTSSFPRKKLGRQLGAKTISRRRLTVDGMYRLMGAGYFRRAFRMTYLAFQSFYDSLESDLKLVMKSSDSKRGPNGRIPLKSRVAIAMRYFAGGAAYDIAPLWGVSHVEVYHSVEDVTEAINQSDAFKLQYPKDHDTQRAIAAGFQDKSKANFDCCAGAIDGMLIWTHKPTDEDCEELGIGSKKFFCGRKHKYGLNLQAVCDHMCRFLDISIIYGGSSSDLLAFENSFIKNMMENPDFLAEGLCFFGDNAYVNRSYMATPYPNVNGYGKEKDNYNFYHSNVRINIECAFGILVQRFGFLRKRAPMRFKMRKNIAVVACLCRIHNWLIDKRVGPVSSLTIPGPTDDDALAMTLEGAVPMETRTGHRKNEKLPNQLLDGGHHFDDDPLRTIRRRKLRATRAKTYAGITDANRFEPEGLPRDNMRMKVSEMGLERPVGNKRNN